MGLPVIQETDENSILFPTRNNQSNAIWQDQMDLDDVMALIESQTHTEGKTFRDSIYVTRQGQLQEWTEHSSLIFENLRPVEI